MKKLIVLAVVLVLLCGSCEKAVNDAGQITYRLDPNTAAQLEKGGETAIDIMQILGAIWPPLAIAGSIGGTALASYKKLKPKWTTAQSEANLYHTATHHIVVMIEDLKKNHPEIWKDEVKPKLDKAMGPEIENVIRSLRGLPPK